MYLWRVTMKGIIKSNKRQYLKGSEAMHRLHMATELLSKNNRCIISWPGFLSHQLLSYKLTFNSAMLNQIKWNKHFGMSSLYRAFFYVLWWIYVIPCKVLSICQYQDLIKTNSFWEFNLHFRNFSRYFAFIISEYWKAELFYPPFIGKN